MIIITINTDNDAFVDDYHAELSWILKELGDTIRRHGHFNGIPLKDSNGNTVGKVEVKRD